MNPNYFKSLENPYDAIQKIISRIHHKGPIDQEDLESLAHFKYFHNSVFKKFEPSLMYLLGLFYKTKTPKNLLSWAYAIHQEAIVSETKQSFTPVQASIRKSILNNRFFSFSAPTSTGKSFLFRDLIRSQENDLVIIVPSRALISEYFLAIQEILHDQKDILILQFVEDINKAKTNRRIFILTPERGIQLLKSSFNFQISLFLFDEAQISEEEFRGLTFDSLVRRVERRYPQAKMVFSHPFVTNPEAQLKKHQFVNDSSYKNYRHNSVGKIFIYHDEANNAFETFSPFVDKPNIKANRGEFSANLPVEIIENGGCILIYISKNSIYDRSFLKKFEALIGLCEEVSDYQALLIIEEIRELIGKHADKTDFVKLLKIGVVVHHGSVPLQIRFLIEKFTNKGFAKICFATSTLTQGVNMPFDLVWVDNLRFLGTQEDKTVGLRNLVGRAGRSTSKKNCFDYGFVITNNIATFCRILDGEPKISDSSGLDVSLDEVPSDFSEFVEAIQNDSIDEQFNLPEKKIDRLSSPETVLSVKKLLDLLFEDGIIISGAKYRKLPNNTRREIKNTFRSVYESSLGRNLKMGEASILSTALSILLWQIQGKAFREILGLRFSYLSQRDSRVSFKKRLDRKEISKANYNKLIDDLRIPYSPIPSSIPNSKLNRVPSRFSTEDSVAKLSYDLLIYDTYDFIDKVISFSLSDVFVAAFGKYFANFEDPRASAMVNYFRYGTNDSNEIWLLKYGFTFEDIEQIGDYIVSIDEDKIVFSKNLDKIKELPAYKLIQRYM